MSPVITTIPLNNTPETEVLPALATHPEEEPSMPAPGPDVADDIDTDELEALLVDLKASKKVIKAAPKKRTRKLKAVKAEPEPIEVPPVVVEPVVEPIVEPVAEPLLTPEKPKRKYVRKPQASPEPDTPLAQGPVEEPVKRSPHAMIEEMQRAERALRYQMRKNKMQTLISQAF